MHVTHPVEVLSLASNGDDRQCLVHTFETSGAHIVPASMDIDPGDEFVVITHRRATARADAYAASSDDATFATTPIASAVIHVVTQLLKGRRGACAEVHPCKAHVHQTVAAVETLSPQRAAQTQHTPNGQVFHQTGQYGGRLQHPLFVFHPTGRVPNREER